MRWNFDLTGRIVLDTFAVPRFTGSSVESSNFNEKILSSWQVIFFKEAGPCFT